MNYFLKRRRLCWKLKKATDDWFDELTEKDKNLLEESKEQYSKGNYISHEELMKRFQDGKRSSLDRSGPKRFLGNCCLPGRSMA